MKPGMSIDDRKIIISLEVDLPGIDFIIVHVVSDNKCLKIMNRLAENVIVLSEYSNNYLLKKSDRLVFFTLS